MPTTREQAEQVVADQSPAPPEQAVEQQAAPETEQALTQAQAAQHMVVREELNREVHKLESNPDTVAQAHDDAGKIEELGEEQKINDLLNIANEKGVAFSVSVAQKMKDPYLLDVYHDLLARSGYYEHFKQTQKMQNTKMESSLSMALYMVVMPRYESSEEKEERQEEKALIAHMEQFLTSFLTLKKPSFSEKMKYGSPRIAMEIASQLGGSDIAFYIAVPRYLSTGLEKYIQGIYPRAIVESIPEDYTVFKPQGHSAGAFLRLNNSPYFPITTYQNLEEDPISGVTNALSKITPDEGAAIQIIIRPFKDKKWLKDGGKILGKIRGGDNAFDAVQQSSRGLAGKAMMGALETVQDVATADDQSAPPNQPLQIDDVGMQAIQAKIQKKSFETNIRIVTSAPTPERAEEILGHIEGTFTQFSLASINSFKMNRLKGRNLEKLLYSFSFRNYENNQRIYLNTEELASVYHFPTYNTRTPYLTTVKSAEAPPPTDMPTEGFVNVIGKANYRGEEHQIGFTDVKDRRRHFYVVGQTGTGKSSILRNMIRQDIQNGQGVAVIDPHGELVDDALADIPRERADDVVLFEPFNLERPVGLNMLEYETLEQKDFAVQEMIAIFHKLFPPEIIGPMFEHYMRNAMLALMANPEDPGTMVEIPRMFTDDQYMEEKVAFVTDPMVKGFWLKEWKQTTGNTKSDMLGYVVSKVGRFVENDMMRNIMGQPHSGFNLSEIMDNGKIFLANLSKGQTGEVNSDLLGLILVSKMQMAAMRRATMEEEQRRDFYLYVDEFQNFTTDSIATILSEARKYRLCLNLAHQYLPQLTDEIRDAVLGNVGTIGAYRIGTEDAELLEKQFEPEFSRFDLVNLDNFTMIMRMMVNNKVTPAFKMMADIPVEGDPNMVEPIRKMSALKYGRPRDVVEQEIMAKAKLDDLG